MRSGLFAILLLACGASAWAQPAPPQPCDRACLDWYVDRYLEAMLQNDVGRDLFARDTKFTENGVRLPLGDEGFWFGMSGMVATSSTCRTWRRNRWRSSAPARENMQVRGANTGDGALVAIAVRLKIVDSRITEVEQLVVRPETTLGGGRGGGAGAGGAAAAPAPSTGDRVEAMGAPHAIFGALIPAAERADREELIETANYYLTGLARTTARAIVPSPTTASASRTASRRRRRTAGSSSKTRCATSSRAFAIGASSRWIANAGTSLRSRSSITSRSTGPGDSPRSSGSKRGQIRRVEAIFHWAPYGIPSGWSTYEQAMLEAIQSVR